MFFPHPLVKLSIVESLRDREVACLASDLKVVKILKNDNVGIFIL